MLNIFKIGWIADVKQSSAFEATIAITNRCNINCVYCYGNYPERNDKDIPLEIKSPYWWDGSMGFAYPYICGEALPAVMLGYWNTSRKRHFAWNYYKWRSNQKIYTLLRRTIDFICMHRREWRNNRSKPRKRCLCQCLGDRSCLSWCWYYHKS